MNHAEQMRKAMNLMEDASSYKGRIEHSAVQYSAEETKGQITKVIANLQAAPSARYTKLGRNLMAIERYSARVAELKEAVKQDTRELIADLFNAEDAARTRVVETVSFAFQLTKDPKATETIQYKKVLDELEAHLTPELIGVLRALEGKYKTVTQKAPALSYTDKRPKEESVTEGSVALEEGFADKLKSYLHKFLGWVQSWGKKYDAKLAKLKASI